MDPGNSLTSSPAQLTGRLEDAWAADAIWRQGPSGQSQQVYNETESSHRKHAECSPALWCLIYGLYEFPQQENPREHLFMSGDQLSDHKACDLEDNRFVINSQKSKLPDHWGSKLHLGHKHQYFLINKSSADGVRTRGGALTICRCL